jgi:hypothetical protein
MEMPKGQRMFQVTPVKKEPESIAKDPAKNQIKTGTKTKKQERFPPWKKWPQKTGGLHATRVKNHI